MRTALLVIRLLGIAWLTVWLTIAFLGTVFTLMGLEVNPHPVATFIVLILYGAPGAAVALIATRLRRRLELRHPPRGFDVLVAAPREGHE